MSRENHDTRMLVPLGKAIRIGDVCCGCPVLELPDCESQVGDRVLKFNSWDGPRFSVWISFRCVKNLRQSPYMGNQSSSRTPTSSSDLAMPSCDEVGGVLGEDDYLDSDEEELAPLKLLDEGPQLPDSRDLEPRPLDDDEEEEIEEEAFWRSHSDPSTEPRTRETGDPANEEDEDDLPDEVVERLDRAWGEACLNDVKTQEDEDEVEVESPPHEAEDESPHSVPPPPPARRHQPPPPPPLKRRRGHASSEEEDDLQMDQQQKSTDSSGPSDPPPAWATPLPSVRVEMAPSPNQNAHPQQQSQRGRGLPPTICRPDSVASQMSFCDTDEDLIGGGGVENQEPASGDQCQDKNRLTTSEVASDSNKSTRGRPFKKPRTWSHAVGAPTQQTPTEKQQQAQLEIRKPPSPHPGRKNNFPSLFNSVKEMTS